MVLLARGKGLPRLMFPGFRDIRGYRAMYRDLAGAIREGRAPQMSLERGMEDQRLMDAAYASADAGGFDAPVGSDESAESAGS